MMLDFFSDWLALPAAHPIRHAASVFEDGKLFASDASDRKSVV
jgi:hypothetical protein